MVAVTEPAKSGRGEGAASPGPAKTTVPDAPPPMVVEPEEPLPDAGIRPAAPTLPNTM